ncbi:hypothetical protein V6N13_052862 [Hibiscus sabdariffa]
MTSFRFLLIFLSAVSVVASKLPVDFYKLSLQWPRSTCSGGTVQCPPYLPKRIVTTFTIHGIWPQDVFDDPIDPYHPSDNPCTYNPTDGNQLQVIFDLRYPTLRIYWPNLLDPLVRRVNERLWRDEWEKHGMCSDFWSNPANYFDSALEIKKHISDFGLSSGNSYMVSDIVDTVYNRVGGAPEVACNTNSTGTVQLWEIRLCYNRPTVAELVEVCWLELIGKLHASKLSSGTLYQVVFIVMLREIAEGWCVPLNFRLTLPNEETIEHEETLENKPRENWIEIPTVEFKTSFENGGEMEININGVSSI